MPTHVAPQVFSSVVGETLNCAASFDGFLDDGETLVGTPAVTEETTSDLTINNKSINASIMVINGLSVAIGKAVQFTVAGQQLAGSPYSIKITVATSAGATRIGWVTIRVANR